MNKINLPLLFFLLFAFGCQKDEAENKPAPEPEPVSELKPTPEVHASIATKPPTEIVYFEARLHGELTSLGTEEIFEYGFVWADKQGPTTATQNKKTFGPATTPTVFTEKLTGLSAGTAYYYRTFVITKAGIRYGNEVSFSTAVMPWVRSMEFGGAARQQALGFSIGNKGYLGLGSGAGITTLQDFWEFDPATKTWTRKADFGGGPRSAAIAFAIGNKGYIGTGADNNGGNVLTYNDFWEYDPTTDKWTRKADFPGGKVYYAAAFVIGNKGYVGTGFRNSNLREFWEYNPAEDKWTRKADFAGTPVDVAVGFSIGSKGYIGVGNLAVGSSNEFWEYDPASDRWTRKKDFPGRSKFLSTGFALNNRGYIGLGYQAGAEFWEYNPAKDEWSRHVDFLGGARESPASLVIGNKAYVGTGQSGGYLKDIWEFNP